MAMEKHGVRNGFLQTMGDAPAFPFVMENEGGEFVEPGMSLRDWFAGQALAAVIGVRATSSHDGWNDMVAKAAYRIADAMIEARKA